MPLTDIEKTVNGTILPTTAERVKRLKVMADLDDAQHLLRYICGEREMWKQTLARGGRRQES